MEIKEGYKQTEVGVIPQDWDLKTFGDVITVFSSGATPYRGHPEFYKGNIRWISSGELNYNIITDTKEKITEEAVHSANLKVHPSGTFLIAITGLEAEGTRGRCGFVGLSSTTNQSCMALYPIKGLLDSKYLFQYYLWQGDNLAFRYCQGTKQQSYTANIAKKLPIILPTLKEQQAIAEVLSDTENLIQSLQKQIAKKLLIKQGVMQKMLAPKGDWIVKKLGEIVSFYKGKGLSKSDLSSYGKYKCIHYGELFTKYKESIIDIISRTNINSNCFYSVQNDVLMPTSDVTPNGLAKASCINENNVILGGDILIIRCSNEILDGVFLSYYISNNKEQVLQLVTGSTVYHLYASDMGKFEICFPPIKEQTSCAKILTEMDNEIKELEEKFMKYKLLKKGLMQNLLTGIIRLKQS